MPVVSTIATSPPGDHFVDVGATLLVDVRLAVAVGTAEFGNGTTTVQRQIAADGLGTVVEGSQGRDLKPCP